MEPENISHIEILPEINDYKYPTGHSLFVDEKLKREIFLEFHQIRPYHKTLIVGRFALNLIQAQELVLGIQSHLNKIKQPDQGKD